MKKICILSLITVLFMSGCVDLYSDCIVGSGNVVSKDFTVDEFQGVDLAVHGDLYLTQDEQQTLRIEAEDNLLEILQVNVENGKLSINSEQCYTNTKPVNIYVSMKDIGDLSISGSGKIIGQTEIKADKLKLGILGSGSLDISLDAEELDTHISGSGDTKLKGSSRIHTIVIDGSGNVKAFDLSTEKTDIRIGGSGNGEVDASKELNMNILGSGNVYYSGEAKVSQSISGSGKVEKR